MQQSAFGWQAALLWLTRRGLVWSGFGSGVALTALLAFIVPLVHGQSRAMLLIMLAVNVVMLLPWNWRTLPRPVCACLAILRGFHWAVNVVFGFVGLLLLPHAATPRRALAYAALSLMFVLWAAAGRRLSADGATVAATRLASSRP